MRAAPAGIEAPRPRRTGLRSGVWLLVAALWLWPAAGDAQTGPLRARAIPVDAAAPESWPAGDWVPVDREEWRDFMEVGDARPASGYADTLEYAARLADGDTLVGTATGALRLTGRPQAVPLGTPGFAMKNVLVDGQPADCGADSEGRFWIVCRRDGAETTFDWSLRGRQRLDQVEFTIAWPTAVASRMRLTVPQDRHVEWIGGVVTGRVAAEPGWETLTLEAGAANGSVLRIGPRATSSSAAVDADLALSIAATTTKLVLQADVGLQARSPGPFTAKIALPEEFSVLRVTLAGGERMPFQRSEDGGAVLIPFPELAVAQRMLIRLVAERAEDWSSPVTLPRIVIDGVTVLRERCDVQIEKPLEAQSFEHPGYVQTDLIDEPLREVWSFERERENGRLTVAAAPPQPVLDASVVNRLRATAGRWELRSAIELRSRRASAYECDLRVRAPWIVTAVEVRGRTGAARPVAWTVADEGESARTLRLQLPRPAGQQDPAILTVNAVAADSSAAGPPDPHVAIHPLIGGETTQWLVATAGDWQLPAAEEASWTSRQPSDLLPAVRAAVAIDAEPAAQVRTWRRLSMPVPAPTGTSPAPRDPQRSAPPAVIDLSSSEGPPAIEVPATVVLETLVAEAGASEHITTASFQFSELIDLSNWRLEFARPTSVIDVYAEDMRLDFAVEGGQVRLPPIEFPAQRLSVRYRSRAESGWLMTDDALQFPQAPCRVAQWQWRVRAPLSRDIAVGPAAVMASGVRGPGWTERWLGPLGRRAGDEIFNPLDAAAWMRLITGPDVEDASPRGAAGVVYAAGFAYPEQGELKSWWTARVEALQWAVLFGAALTIVFVRRVAVAAYRSGAFVIALAATGAAFAPDPWPAVFGAALCGGILAFLIPRRLVRREPAPTPEPRGSSIQRALAAGATALLLAAGLSFAGADPAEEVIEWLDPQRDGQPEPLAYVSPSVAERIARNRRQPAWLTRRASYEFTTSGDIDAAVAIELELLTLASGRPVVAALPFEGLTFRSGEGATLDGVPIRLTPLRDGAGLAIPLPLPQASGDGDASAGVLPVRRATLRLSGLARIHAQPSPGFAVGIPTSTSATAKLTFTDSPAEGATFESRGRIQRQDRVVEADIGGRSRLVARWRSASAGNGPSEGPPVARAESMVFVEPLHLRCRTRITIEGPEAPDPFAPATLRLMLPVRANLQHLSTSGLRHWQVREVEAGVELTLGLDAPPAAQQSIDLEFVIPQSEPADRELPALALLDVGQLRSHQIAFACGQAFQMQLGLQPDPASGVLSLAATEASFSLRRDVGLPLPQAAIELQTPQAVPLRLEERTVRRTAEIDQILSADVDGIQWEGHIRVETQGRAALFHEVLLDARVQLQSASVLEKDVDRLSRSVRSGDRLLLMLRDDRPGTHLIHLTGRLAADHAEWQPAPRMTLLDARVTRSELVVVNSLQGRLDVRSSREIAAELPAASEFGSEGGLSRRLSDSAGQQYDVRWLPPRNRLIADSYVWIETQNDQFRLNLEWRFHPGSGAVDELELDVPETASQLQIGGEFQELERRPYPHGGYRLVLRRTAPGRLMVPLLVDVDVREGAEPHQALPRLLGVTIPRTGRWLAVPLDLVDRVEAAGTRVDVLPESAPGDWQTSLGDRRLMVTQTSEWRLRPANAVSESFLGGVTSDTLATLSGNRVLGLTTAVIVPLETGALRIAPPPGGLMEAVWLDDRLVAAAQRDVAAIPVGVIRAQTPAAVVIRWTAPADIDRFGRWTARLPRFENLTDFRPSTVRLAAPDRRLVGDGARGAFVDRTEASLRTLSLMLQLAEQSPSEDELPEWLKGCLLEQGRLAETTTAGQRSLPQEMASRLAAVLARIRAASEASTSRPAAATPAEAFRTSAFQSAGEVLATARMDSRSLGRVTQNGVVGFSFAWPRGWLLATLGAAWFAIVFLVLRQTLKVCSQRRVADRVATSPWLALGLLGLVMWLLLATSVIGFGLLLAAAAWGLAGVRRSWRTSRRVRV
ncbi:MAG: hypothetical protein KF774_12725 [Planctomyces sp.]|nr:hypothetical protein [Planctomyces sp.]